MLPTPSTSHLSFESIYEPSEDSYLLLDTLSHSSQINYLSSRFPPGTSVPLVLEVGPGSGVVLAFITANARIIFGRVDVLACGVDVNGFACKGTTQTVRRALKDSRLSGHGGAFADCLRGGLASCFRNGTVDLCVFNPPYVPSEVLPDPSIGTEDLDNVQISTFSRDSMLLALATDGGVDGMEVTNRLLNQLELLLSTRGVAYILLCAQNKPEKVKQYIRGWGNEWAVETVHTSGKQGGWEKLQIIRIERRLND